MFGLGPWELGIILVIVLIIFGAGKLPDIGAGIGKGIKNFKKGMAEAENCGEGGKGGVRTTEDPNVWRKLREIIRLNSNIEIFV